MLKGESQTKDQERERERERESRKRDREIKKRYEAYILLSLLLDLLPL